MKVLGAHVEKGGTGKTTTVGNAAYWICKERKTVIFDGDPQGNLTSWLVTDPCQWELADVLCQDTEFCEAAVFVRDNLAVVPTFGIDGRLGDFRETALLFKHPTAFNDLIDAAAQEGFEVAIFDMGPGISPLEQTMLSLMSEVIAVAALEYFSFDGLEIFENELAKIRRQFRKSIQADRIVLNRYNRSYSLHQAYREQFDSLQYELYVIGQSTSISDAVPRHLFLHEYAPRDPHNKEYRRLAQNVLSGERLLA